LAKAVKAKGAKVGMYASFYEWEVVLGTATACK
jgi:hypothetical protein